MSSPPNGSRLAIAGWVLFDWACQPFFTLITTFIYAPYFASAVVGDPVRGQALWGFATAAAGIVIALGSPVVGAIADATGRHKPWIAAFGALLVIGCVALWFGWPGDAASILVVLVAFAIGAIGVEFATVFNNAMMPRLVPRSRIGWLSGLGWGMGYVGGLVSLMLSLAFLAADPHTGRTLLGFAPAFGLDAAAREGERAIGPLSALWFIVFVIPLFAFTPDGKRALPIRHAAGAGLASFAATLRQARAHRNVALFLLANMIYTDGLIALFAFGGIYAAGTFGWGSIEIGIFGILLTITGTLGAVIGGRLDDRIGAKPGGPRLAHHPVRGLPRHSVDRPRHDPVRRSRRAAGRPRPVRELAGAALCGAWPLHRPRGGAAAGRVPRAGGAARAAGPHHAILRAVRAFRQAHVVHGPASGRDGDRRHREPEGRRLGAARVLSDRRLIARARADQWRKWRTPVNTMATPA